MVCMALMAAIWSLFGWTVDRVNATNFVCMLFLLFVLKAYRHIISPVIIWHPVEGLCTYIPFVQE